MASIDDIIKRGGLKDLIRSGKKLRTGFQISEEALEAVTNNLLGSTSDSGLFFNPGSTDAYLIHIRMPNPQDPSQTITYVTIAQNGRAIMLAENFQGVELSPDEIYRTIAAAGMPEKIRLDIRTSKPGPGTNPPLRTHFNVTLYDPAVVEYIKANANILVFAAMDGQNKNEDAKRIREQDLNQIIDPNILDSLLACNAQVTGQSIVDYIAKSRTKIQKMRKVYIEQLIQNSEELEQVVSAFIKTHHDDLSDLLCPATSPSQSQNATSYYQTAKRVYNNLKVHCGTAIPIQHAVDALRYTLLETYLPLLGVEQDKAKVNTAIDNTSIWIACAKAADYARDDTFIQDELIPLIQKNQDQKSADMNFEISTLLARRLIEKNNNFERIHLRFSIVGMWMQDYFSRTLRTKSSESAHENVSSRLESSPAFSSGQQQERSAYGVLVEYFQTATHLDTRHEQYHPLLIAGFTSGVKNRIITTPDFSSASSCESIGRNAFYQINALTRQHTFTNLTTGKPLDEKGFHLSRILRCWVGVHKEELQQMYCQHSK